MLSFAVLAGPWPRLGVVAAAVLAAMAILARTGERRAWAMLGALVLAPVLLLDDVWHSTQLRFVHDHPAEALVGAAFALAVLAGAAYVVRRNPWLVAPLTALTVPFRIPISTGSGATATTNNLLVPLYFVIAAAALAWLVPVLWRSRAETRSLSPPSEPRPERLLFEKLLAAFIVLYAIQALYSTDFVKALQNEVFFYVPFAILLALLRDLDWTREQLLRCLAVTVVLALAFSLIGYVEEATKHLWLSSKLVASNQLHPYFTVNSVFFDPNIFGRYLALVMILLAAVLLYDPRPRIQLASLGALAVLWVSLVFTISRSSVVALALGLLVLAVHRWKPRTAVWVSGVVALVIAGGILVAIKPADFGLNAGANNATSGRASLITGGLGIFGRRPIQGYGSGSFTREYTHFDPVAARSVSDSHNIAVTVAAEQGIIGVIVYAALVIAALVALFRGARGDPFRVAIAAAFLALLLHTMLYADFLEDPVTWTLLAIGGSLAVAARAAAVPEPRRRNLRAVA
ncbi:MAG: O-antigen ligase family protein [Conexibacteraceae bacterium]|nr:O-antigen ligase family protein [Conexibacteraceae bacterium]